MYELKDNQFYRAAHLLKGSKIPSPEINSVIEGNNPGWIFVNNLTSPTVAIIWPQGMEGFHFAGDYRDEYFLENINGYIDTVLQPKLKESGFNFFEVSGDDDKWNRTIERIFSHRNLKVGIQYVSIMEHIEAAIADGISIPAEFELKRIDRSLDLNRYINKDFLINVIKGFWGSLEGFFSKGVGYCTVLGDTITGMGYTGYISGDTYTIGIETNEQFRRKGLAEASVRAVLKEYSALGVRAYWDCMEENIASYSLACKVGFKKIYEYSVYWFNF